MDKAKPYDMSDLMPVYWEDRLGFLHLRAIEGAEIEIKDDSQMKNVTPSKRTLTEIERVIRNSGYSKDLKNSYKNKCQVCGKRLRLKNGYFSETHHLQPLGGNDNGVDDPSNMIVVCPNHHALFDYGAIAINPETLKVIDFDGSEIGTLFIDPNHTIGREFLKYHFDKFKSRLS